MTASQVLSSSSSCHPQPSVPLGGARKPKGVTYLVVVERNGKGRGGRGGYCPAIGGWCGTILKGTWRGN